MTTDDEIRSFRKIFRGRQDIVPRYWTSYKTGRSGYSPLCKNEWKTPECGKGKIRNACHACTNRAYVPLSDPLLHDHFRGKHILGVYPLLPDHTCHFMAADFDNHKGERPPLEDVLAFHETCQVQDVPCHVLRSKSGRGYHAFVFFDGPVPAWKARLVGFGLLKEAEAVGDDMELASFDRLFPNQDRLSGKGLGNLIALPFQGRATRANHTLFLNRESGFTKPCGDQWRVVADVERIGESVLDNLIREWNLKESPRTKSSDAFRYTHQHADIRAFPISDFDQIAERCAFIAHCRDDAETLPEPDWYILLTISARCESGERISHHLSMPYPAYTYEETDAKICQALNKTGPYCCPTIRRINGKYCTSCHHYGKIRSPIVLGWAN